MILNVWRKEMFGGIPDTLHRVWPLLTIACLWCQHCGHMHAGEIADVI